MRRQEAVRSGPRFRAWGSHLAAWAEPVWEAAIDVLMPRRCFVCGDHDITASQDGEASAGFDVCDAHRIRRGLFGPARGRAVPFAQEFAPSARCGRCLAPLPPGVAANVPCRSCSRQPPSFAGAAAGFDYAEPGVSDWILRFKHGARSDLALPLARMAHQEWERGLRSRRLAAAPGRGDLLVPVPLHPARYAERGYNQAALMAAEVARLVGGHFLPILERSRATFVQGELAAPPRRLNVRDAFRAVSSLKRFREGPKPPRIWIVDDVLTTGATASACAAAVRRAGGSAPLVLVLARA